jgi:hypothetical protein
VETRERCAANVRSVIPSSHHDVHLDTDNSKDTFGRIDPTPQAGSQAHLRPPAKSLSESLAVSISVSSTMAEGVDMHGQDVPMLSDSAGSSPSSSLCSQANVTCSKQEEGFQVSGIDVTRRQASS